ncbi:MAG: CRISPR-associated endonuclease Cas2, partial [Runella sp.]
MPRPKPLPPPPTLPQLNDIWAEAGLPHLTSECLLQAPPLPEQMPVYLRQLLDFLRQNPTKRPEEMYCFIMYDIENHKIRRTVAKFLEKKGCLRVQKSVFFARLHRKMYLEIAEIIKELNQCYENQDSILMLPVGEDMLNN